MPYKNKIDQQRSQRKHYEANKKKIINRAGVHKKKQRNELRVLIRLIKSQPCVDCKKQYPYYVMDFDHRFANKVLEVSLMVGRAVSKDTLLSEIKKCEVVCANCHRERTHARSI